jgi:hypothetical protein
MSEGDTNDSMNQNTERTPLITPDASDAVDEEYDTNPMVMFWEEVRILAKYTLPVVMFVYLPLDRLRLVLTRS